MKRRKTAQEATSLLVPFPGLGHTLVKNWTLTKSAFLTFQHCELWPRFCRFSGQIRYLLLNPSCVCSATPAKYPWDMVFIQNLYKKGALEARRGASVLMGTGLNRRPRDRVSLLLASF